MWRRGSDDSSPERGASSKAFSRKSPAASLLCPSHHQTIGYLAKNGEGCKVNTHSTLLKTHKPFKSPSLFLPFAKIFRQPLSAEWLVGELHFPAYF